MPLTEDQRLIQDTARQFAFDRLRPNAAAWDQGSVIPDALEARSGIQGTGRALERLGSGSPLRSGRNDGNQDKAGSGSCDHKPTIRLTDRSLIA